jgi:hypothetical protein
MKRLKDILMGGKRSKTSPIRMLWIQNMFCFGFKTLALQMNNGTCHIKEVFEVENKYLENGS